MTPAELYADLLGYGVPVVLCKPHKHRSTGTKPCRDNCDNELDRPSGWQKIAADAKVIDRYRPGLHTPAIVTGHVLDAIDVDAKNGADVAEQADIAKQHGVQIVGMNISPSSGAHFFVPSTGIASAAEPSNGVDFRGGCSDGTGRGLIYLPGSSRPKYPGRDYTVAQPIDWTLVAAVDFDEQRDAIWSYLQSVGIKPRLSASSPATSSKASTKTTPTAAEPLPTDGLPAELAEKIGDLGPQWHGVGNDRSERFFHLVGECYRAGLSQGQAVSALTGWCDAVGKYVGRVDTQVATCWEKIDADETHAWIEEVNAATEPSPEPPKHVPITVEQAKAIFRHWLGDAYDLDAMLATVAVAACVYLDGDTPWLLVVSGSGFTKTETVSALAGGGALVTSTINSEGALLSATARRERAKNATGGLLRQVGAQGVLVIKDVTSILSMGRELRAQVLAALREVADGYWQRNVGTDGGQTLTWKGRCVTVGAVTTSWDKHHQVVAEMGDRFLLVRMDSDDQDSRESAGMMALEATGHETEMRAALQAAVGGLIAGLDASRIADLSRPEKTTLLHLADVAARCRTAVERDGHQKPEWAHASEAPTRLAKYLWQLVRGALAIGVDRADAFRLAARVAADCMPPLRRRVLLDVRAHPATNVASVAKRLQLPWSTTDRAMQELHLLGAVEADKDDTTDGKGWRYTCSEQLHGDALDLMVNPTGYEEPSPGKSVCAQPQQEEGTADADPTPSPHPATDISGETPARCQQCQQPILHDPRNRVICAKCEKRNGLQMTLINTNRNTA